MLKKIFLLQDNDKSGTLSNSEVILMSSNPEKIRTYFQNLDKDKDGKVTYKEFTKFFETDDKKQNIEHLYKWLTKNSETIKIFREYWVQSVDKFAGGKYSLKTPLFVNEALRVLQHLNLDRQSLSDLHQFLHYTKVLDQNYIYYGELLSLVCYWYS